MTDDYIPIEIVSSIAVLEKSVAPVAEATQLPASGLSPLSGFLVILLLIGLLLVFRALSHVCECFLVPAVEVLINEFDVPEEMAGVTLLAFGSAAPEITMNSVSSMGEDSSSISLTSILGSAMIAFGLIPGLCILMTRNCTHMNLSVWPIFREVAFFSVTLMYFFFSIEDGIMTTSECIHLIMVYFCYVLLVVGMFYLRKRGVKQDEEDSRPRQSGDAVDVEAVTKECMPARYACLIKPWTMSMAGVDFVFERVLYHTIPSLVSSHNGKSKLLGKSSCCEITLCRALCSLGVSIVYVTIFSAFLVHIGMTIVSVLEIEGGTLGATLIALGAQIPDIMNSIALSRSGFFDAAMANAIGSQVINVSIGIGLPMAISCVLFNGEVLITKGSAQSLSLLAILLFVIITVYIVMILPILSFVRCKLSRTTTLSRCGSTVLIICFFFSHVVYIMENEVLS